MSRQKIIITLSLKDQKFLEQLLSKGTAPARKKQRAHILLNSNAEGDKQYTTDDARIKLKHLYPIVTF